MRMPIARIRIAAGNPGWYDPLTNIHLTITRPEAFVYEGQNPTNIKTAIACKLVSLIEGSLNPIKREEPIIVNEPVRGQEPKQEEVVVKSIKEETATNEVVNEEVTTKEEPKVETKKRTTRRTTTKKKTTEDSGEE